MAARDWGNGCHICHYDRSPRAGQGSYRVTVPLASQPFSQRVDRRRPAAIFRRLREAGFGRPKAPVAELVDALDSKSSSARSAGSIPARGTILLRADALRRIASAKIAKQDALRSLGGGGLPRCIIYICCRAKRFRANAMSASPPTCGGGLQSTMLENPRIPLSTFLGDW